MGDGLLNVMEDLRSKASQSIISALSYTPGKMTDPLEARQKQRFNDYDKNMSGGAGDGGKFRNEADRKTVN
jgi:hypothetical protein